MVTKLYDKISKFFKGIFSAEYPLPSKALLSDFDEQQRKHELSQVGPEVANAVMPNYDQDTWKLDRARSFINTAGRRPEHDIIYNIDNAFHMVLANRQTYMNKATKNAIDVIDYDTYLEMCEESEFFWPNPAYFPDQFGDRQPKYPMQFMVERISDYRRLDSSCVPFASTTLSISLSRKINFDVYRKLGYITENNDMLYPRFKPGEMFKVSSMVTATSDATYLRHHASHSLFSTKTAPLGAEDATNGVPNLENLTTLKTSLKVGTVIMYLGFEQLNDFLAMRSFTATWLIDGKIVNAIIPLSCIEKLQ